MKKCRRKKPKMPAVSSPSISPAPDSAVIASGFDPLARFYVVQDERPPGVAPVDAGTLTPYQRALLAIDGTVTQFIEAWTLEPVEVLRLDQCEELLDSSQSWLGLDAGAPVIRRRVMLRGSRSGCFHAWADSIIAVERLGMQMRGALDLRGGGIGRILIDTGIEARREALWYGREQPVNVPPAVAELWPGDFLSRTYRVVASGQPLILITERFPL